MIVENDLFIAVYLRWQFFVRSLSWPFCIRVHHLRALVALVTLMSLSMLFSTFTMRIGESRFSVMDPVHHHQGRRAVMSAEDHQHQSFALVKGRTGAGEVIQVTRDPTRSSSLVKVRPLRPYF